MQSFRSPRLFVLAATVASVATPAAPRFALPELARPGQVWTAQIVVPDPDQPPPFVPEAEVSEQEDEIQERRERQPRNRTEEEAPEIVEVEEPLPQVATTPATTLVVQRIEEDTGICDDVPGPFVLDCLARRFDGIARSLPKTGDYALAREALETMSNEIDSVVRANRSLGFERQTVTIVVPDGTETGERTRLKQVDEDAAATARARALQVIEEQTTILLRSASENPAQAVHYTRIAQAVDSTKLLLRS